MNRRTVRWAVPGAVAATLAAAIMIPTLASADPDTDLAPLSVTELLTAVASAEPTPLSGEAVYTARLGLPELPAELTQGADPLNLLEGSSTIRMWTDGESRSRVSLLGATSEYSVVVDGTQAWSYASESGEVRHFTLDDASAERLAEVEAAAEIPTPESLAGQFLAEIDEDAQVSMGETTVIAGRAAYQLVIDPTAEQTLVDQIVIAIDGLTFVPLSVQVWSTQDGAAPALEVAFTDIRYAMPSEASLTFSVPSGAVVTETEIDLSAASPQDHEGSEEAASASVTGSGFATIIERSGVDLADLLGGDIPTGADATEMPSELEEEFEGPDSIEVAALFDQLTTEVDGGRVLTTTLFSVLLTDDGRVLIGAVGADTLLDTAGLS